MYKIVIITLSCVVNVSLVVLKTEVEDYQLKMCVDNIIRNNFKKHGTLFFLKIDNDDHSFADETKHPYVIVDLKKNVTKFTNYMNYKPVFIAHLTLENMHKLLAILYDSVLWNKSSTIKATYILITSSPIFTVLFKQYWSIGIVNVVIISYGRNQHDYYVRIFTSNPQAPENDCGRKVNLVEYQKCTPTIQIRFPKTIRKYNNCNITVSQTSLMNRFALKTNSVGFMVDSIIDHLNACKVVNNLDIYNKFALLLSTLDDYKFAYQSSVIAYDDFVWIVPTPRKLVSGEVLKIVFKKNVWCAILLSYWVTSIMWWLLLKVTHNNSSISSTLLIIYSITLFGSTEKSPTRFSLKLIFISYVIYSVHIQTAFTSNLINILTVPQFEKPIISLEELASSNLSIFITEKRYNRYFEEEGDADNLYSRIRKKLIICNATTFQKLIFDKETYSKYSYLYQKEQVDSIQTFLNTKIYGIVDNSITGSYKGIILTYYNSYFAETLFHLITVFVETGLQNYFYKQIEFVQKFYVILNYERGFDENVVLNLGHLTFPFLFWIVGVLIGTVVFVVEKFNSKLYDASYHGRFDEVKNILEQGQCDINYQNEFSTGKTPLYIAASWGTDDHLKTIEILLEHGAEIDLTDARRQTPLYVAASWGHLDVVKYLIKSGADLEVKNHEGRTALHIAACLKPHMNSHKFDAYMPKNLRLLIKLAVKSMEGYLKDFACYLPDLDADLLILRKWDCNSPIVMEIPDKIAELAIYYNHFGVVVALVNAGADIDAQDQFFQTALVKAKNAGHLAMVEFLTDMADAVY
ncbi:hypothetical protein FQR65_LT03492 [Abscondita terminalis]|nr:hypothetical protein FQR65_LT03492 [Abscondita terminalis]